MVDRAVVARRLPGSGCRRSPTRRVPTPRCRRHVFGIASPRSRPSVVSRTAQHRVLGASLARADGDQGTVVGSPRTSRSRWPRRRHPPPGRGDNRLGVRCNGGTARQEELFGAGWALEQNRWSPRIWATSTTGNCMRATRSLVPPRPIGPGVERRRGCRRSGRRPTRRPRPASPSSSQRYGSATSTPWSTSTTSSRHVAGGRPVIDGAVAAAGVGALAVVRLRPAQPRLALLGLLRHEELASVTGHRNFSQPSSIVVTVPPAGVVPTGCVEAWFRRDPGTRLRSASRSARKGQSHIEARVEIATLITVTVLGGSVARASPGERSSATGDAGLRRRAEATTATAPRDRLPRRDGQGPLHRHGERPASAAATASSAPAELARRFLADTGRCGLTDQGRAPPRPPLGGEDGKTVRFQQLSQGVPVLRPGLVVNIGTSPATWFAASVEVLPSPRSTSPRRSRRRPPSGRQLDLVAQRLPGRPRAARRPRPELWIPQPGVDRRPRTRSRSLVWRVEVTSTGEHRPRAGPRPCPARCIVLNFNQIAEALNRPCVTATGSAIRTRARRPQRAARARGRPASPTSTMRTTFRRRLRLLPEPLGRDSVDGKGKALLSTVRYCPTRPARSRMRSGTATRWCTGRPSPRRTTWSATNWPTASPTSPHTSTTTTSPGRSTSRCRTCSAS